MERNTDKKNLYYASLLNMTKKPTDKKKYIIIKPKINQINCTLYTYLKQQHRIHTFLKINFKIMFNIYQTIQYVPYKTKHTPLIR